MRNGLLLTAILLVLLLLAGCNANCYVEIDLTAFGDEQPDSPALLALLNAAESRGETALFERDPESGAGYLLVTTGTDNQLKQYLELTGDEYNRISREFTLYLTRFIPKTNSPSNSDHDWQKVVRFREVSFALLRVVINVEGDLDGSNQKIYELTAEAEGEIAHAMLLNSAKN